MKILVTGATGFIGTQLSETLAKSGHQVRDTARSIAPNRSITRELITCDLESANNLDHLTTGCDAIVHLAGRAHVMSDNPATSESLYLSANVDVTRRLAQSAARTGVKRMILMSSVKVNGESTTIGSPFTSQDTPNPQDPYGRSKAQAEQALWDVTSMSELEGVVIRPPLVYGPGVRANFASLIGIINQGIPLPLSSIRNKRSFVSVDNLIDCIATALQSSNAAGQTFLVSDGNDLSTPELIRSIATSLHKSPMLIPIPTALLRLAATIAGKRGAYDRLCGSLTVDIALTKQKLSWTPPFTVQDSLQRTVDAFIQSRDSR
jgi:nucleoside-diphosphate-sugar epimerase